MLSTEMIDELVEGLRKIFSQNISEIILYGSVARGEATEESDVDIAIILEKAQTAQNKEDFISWNADMDLKYDKVFSIVDIEREKLRQWGDILPFYKNVQREGIVLWRAA